MHRAFVVDQGLAVLFALLTAFANAVALTTQHVASTRTREKMSHVRLAIFLFSQPLWLVGWLGLIGSAVFQALALHFGPLAEVQPFLVSELVMALLIRGLWLGQRIRALAWVSALLTSLGLVCFLVASSPSAGVAQPSRGRWTVVVITVAVVALGLALSARHGSDARRAGLYAAATGVTWALVATFIKATTHVIAVDGYGRTLTHWPLYAFIVGGIVGLLFEQAALHVGPLRVSQPFIVIIDPVVSVVLGLWLYGERLQPGLARHVATVVGFLVVVVGVIVVTQSAPDTMKAELHRV